MGKKYIIPIEADPSALIKGVRDANAALVELDKHKVMVEIDYEHGDIDDIRKAIQALTNYSPEIKVQLDYDLFSASLKQKQKELADNNSILEALTSEKAGKGGLSKYISSIIDEVNDGLKKGLSKEALAEKLKLALDLENSYYNATKKNISDDVSERLYQTKNKLKSLDDYMPSGELFRITRDNIEKDTKIIEGLKLQLTDLKQAGAIDSNDVVEFSDIKSATKDIDTLGDTIQETQEQASSSGKIKFFDGVKEQVYDVKEDLEEIRQLFDTISKEWGATGFRAATSFINKEGRVTDNLYSQLAGGYDGPSLGSGTYFSSLFKDILSWSEDSSHNRNIYAANIGSLTDMLQVESDEYLYELTDMFQHIHAYISKDIFPNDNYTDILGDLDDVNIDALYDKYSQQLRDFGVSQHDFKKFIEDQIQWLSTFNDGTGIIPDDLKTEESFTTKFLRQFTNAKGFNLSNLGAVDSSEFGTVVWDSIIRNIQRIDFGDNTELAEEFAAKIFNNIISNKAKNPNTDLEEVFKLYTGVGSKALKSGDIKQMAEKSSFSEALLASMLQSLNQAKELQKSAIDVSTADLNKDLLDVNKIKQPSAQEQGVQDSSSNQFNTDQIGEDTEETERNTDAHRENNEVRNTPVSDQDPHSESTQEDTEATERNTEAHRENHDAKEGAPSSTAQDSDTESMRENTEETEKNTDAHRENNETKENPSEVGHQEAQTEATREDTVETEKNTEAHKENKESKKADDQTGQTSSFTQQTREDTEETERNTEAHRENREEKERDSAISTNTNFDHTTNKSSTNIQGEVDALNALGGAAAKAAANKDLVKSANTSLGSQALVTTARLNAEADALNRLSAAAILAAANKEKVTSQNVSLSSQALVTTAQLNKEATALDGVADSASNAATAKKGASKKQSSSGDGGGKRTTSGQQDEKDPEKLKARLENRLLSLAKKIDIDYGLNTQYSEPLMILWNRFLQLGDSIEEINKFEVSINELANDIFTRAYDQSAQETFTQRYEELRASFMQTVDQIIQVPELSRFFGDQVNKIYESFNKVKDFDGLKNLAKDVGNLQIDVDTFTPLEDRYLAQIERVANIGKKLEESPELKSALQSEYQALLDRLNNVKDSEESVAAMEVAIINFQSKMNSKNRDITAANKNKTKVSEIDSLLGKVDQMIASRVAGGNASADLSTLRSELAEIAEVAHQAGVAFADLNSTEFSGLEQRFESIKQSVRTAKTEANDITGVLRTMAGNANNYVISSMTGGRNGYDTEAHVATIETIRNRIEALKTTYGELAPEVQKATSAMQAYETAMSNAFTKNVGDQLQKSFETLSSAFNRQNEKGGFVADVESRVTQTINELQSAIAKFHSIKTSGGLFSTNDLEKFNALIQKAAGNMDELSKGSNKLAKEGSVDKLLMRVNKDISSNALFGDIEKRYLSLRDSLEKIKKSAQGVSEVDMTKFNNQWKELHQQMVASGMDQPRFINQFRSAITNQSAQFLATYFSLQDFVRYGREMVQTVTAIDSSLTELRKVSGESDTRIAESFKTASETAKQYGATITDVIKTTSDWSRLGYEIDEAENLAKATQLFQNVGDEMNQETASQYLVSTMQGFQLESDKVFDVIDKYNEVANNFAINTAGIGEALERSAASFNASGTSLDKSIALVTATAEVTQDPSSAGTVWKTMSARIRGKCMPICDEDRSPHRVKIYAA